MLVIRPLDSLLDRRYECVPYRIGLTVPYGTVKRKDDQHAGARRHSLAKGSQAGGDCRDRPAAVLPGGIRGNLNVTARGGGRRVEDDALQPLPVQGRVVARG